MPFDMSDNCQLCGANPHEECRFPNMGNHQAINCKLNRVAHDSREDDRKTHSRLEHEEENHPDAVMIFRADSAMTSSDASKPVYSFSEEKRKRKEEQEKRDPSELKTSKDVFETIWSFIKGKTLRSKGKARNNKERAEVKRMRQSPVAMDPDQQRRLKRELGLPSAYEGDEFQTE